MPAATQESFYALPLAAGECSGQKVVIVIQSDYSANFSIKTSWRWLLLPALLLLFVAWTRLQWPELSHGDDWSDASVLVAGENFSNQGFGASYGLPIFYPRADHVPPPVRPDKADWTPLEVFGTYARLPPLYHWIAGLLHPMVGDSIVVYRFFTILGSLFAVAAFLALAMVMTGSARLACLATGFYVANPYFLANFDSLHGHVYMDLFRNLALLGLALLIKQNKTPAWGILAATWCALYLETLTTYEYLPLLTLTIVMASAWILFRNRNGTKALLTIALGTAIAAGLLLHFALVASYYGGIQEAFQDRLANAAQRISGDKNLLGTAGAFTWAAWYQMVPMRFFSQASIIGITGLVIASAFGAVCAAALSTKQRAPVVIGFGLGLFLLIGSSIWYVLMPAHCLDHAGLSFLQKYLVPGMSLLLAVPCEAAFRLLEQSKAPQYLQWGIPGVLAGMIVSVGLYSSELPITREKIALEREFLKIKECLVPLSKILKPSDFIASNVMRPTWMMMAYTKTRTIQISTPEQFDALTEKPKMFLLVPTNDPATQALAKRLEFSYQLVATCDNQRLPFYILERR